MTELTNTDLQKIKYDIENAIENWSIKSLAQEPRTHLGISEIGERCSRKLYYKFRWVAFEQYTGRMLRLFNRGHREEEKYISYLESIGCSVKRFSSDGKQIKVAGFLDHYGGSCDGIAITPFSSEHFLLEFKTHNTKSFTNYVNIGLEKAKPQHKDQMDCYGWKLGLKYGIYFPENKNDDDIQISVVKLNWERAAQLEKKAEEIISATEPPPKISDNPSYFECSYCFAKDICHFKAIPQRNCRSCKLSKPIENGEWFCNKYKDILPNEFIKKGCEAWVKI